MNTVPNVGASRERMNAIWAEHRAALVQEIANVPGLTTDFDHSHTLAWLAWDGDGHNGYWVGSGIAYHSHRPEHQLPGHVTASYLDEALDGFPYPNATVLYVELPPARARDAETAAALIVAAVRVHGRRKGLLR